MEQTGCSGASNLRRLYASQCIGGTNVQVTAVRCAPQGCKENKLDGKESANCLDTSLYSNPGVFFVVIIAAAMVIIFFQCAVVAAGKVVNDASEAKKLAAGHSA